MIKLFFNFIFFVCLNTYGMQYNNNPAPPRPLTPAPVNNLQNPPMPVEGPPSPPRDVLFNQSQSPIFILSIDGAAVRGIGQLEILRHIEKAIGYKITDIFDFFVGTSAGSINVGSLLIPSDFDPKKPKYTLDQLANDLGPTALKTAFTHDFLRDVRTLWGLSGSKYSAKPLEELLMQVAGNAKMSDLVKPAIITSFDIINRELYLFSSLHSWETHEKDHFLWEAMRSSSAAPTFFKPFVEFLSNKPRALIDAGLFVNSPDLLAWVEVFKRFPNRQIFIVSISGGHIDLAREIKTKGNAAGNLLETLGPAIESGFEGQSALNNYLLRGMPNTTYHRLSFNVVSKEFGDMSETNINQIKDSVQQLVQSPEFVKMSHELHSALQIRAKNNDTPDFKNPHRQKIKRTNAAKSIWLQKNPPLSNPNSPYNQAPTIYNKN